MCSRFLFEVCKQQQRHSNLPKEKKEKSSKKQIESLLTSDQLLRSNYLLTQTSTVSSIFFFADVIGLIIINFLHFKEKLIELLYQFRGFNADKSDEKNSCFVETQDHLCMVTDR